MEVLSKYRFLLAQYLFHLNVKNVAGWDKAYLLIPYSLRYNNYIVIGPLLPALALGAY